MASNPPTPPQEEEMVLVRGSAAYREYMLHQFGWLKAMVNGLEDGLAISGRSLLLIFILYTTVNATLAISGHAAPWWLDAMALSLQVCGLEGAIPGLARLREALLATNQPAAAEDAETVRKAIKSARLLNMLTGVEIFLAAYIAFQPPFLKGLPVSIADVSKFYGYALLLYRLWKITEFLSAMARMETKRPKVISQEGFDQGRKEREQEQIRMDNAAIQKAIAQAITASRQDQDRQLADQIAHLAEMLQSEQARVNTQLFAALEEMKQMGATTMSVPQADMQVLIAGVVAQFDARFTTAMKQLEREMKQHIRVSLAYETPERKQETSLIQPPGETSKRVSLPARSVSSRPMKPSMERETGQPEAGENATHKATVYALLDQDNTAQVADLVRLTGISRTTVWRHWNRYHEEHATRGLARMVAGESEAQEGNETTS